MNVDEDNYRSTLNEIVNQVCPFERSLLARHCACRHAHIFNLAEREGVRCEAGLRNKNCVALRDFLRKSVNFTFRLTDSSEKLPYAKQIKMQAGGLIALQKILYGKDEADVKSATKVIVNVIVQVIVKVEDIYQLVIDLEKQYTDLSQLPMVEVLKEIAAFKVRHRSK